MKEINMENGSVLKDKMTVKGIDVTLWKNTHAVQDEKIEGGTREQDFFNFKIEKNFLNKETNEWQKTNQFKDSDIPLLIQILNVLYGRHISKIEEEKHKQRELENDKKQKTSQKTLI